MHTNTETEDMVLHSQRVSVSPMDLELHKQNIHTFDIGTETINNMPGGKPVMKCVLKYVGVSRVHFGLTSSPGEPIMPIKSPMVQLPLHFIKPHHTPEQANAILTTASSFLPKFASTGLKSKQIQPKLINLDDLSLGSNLSCIADLQLVTYVNSVQTFQSMSGLFDRFLENIEN